ncbi:MAG: hypothetical protein ACO2OW_01280 [Minisyncoccia bacterium]|mgnify:FL=1|jgi:ribosome-associated translation inhibitor RaiA
MKIVYYLKNLKNLPQDVINFIKRKSQKLSFIEKKEGEGILEVEIKKDKEVKEKNGLYKVKIIFDTPKRTANIAFGLGKNFYQAINDAFKKLIKNIKK